MKLLKYVASIALLFALQPLQAKTTAQAPVTQEQKQQLNLKKFNDSVKIRYLERGLMQDQNNQPILQFRYEIENVSKKLAIQELNWVMAFIYNNQVIVAQNVPLKLSKKEALKAQTKMPLVLNLPLNTLPADVQKIMLDGKADLRAISGAKSIIFTNGSKIIVE